MDGDLAELLEAHVRYELDRWRGDAVRGTVADEVAAFFDGLDGVQLGAAVPLPIAQAWVRRVVVEEPVSDEWLDELDAAAYTVRDCLLDEDARLGEVLPPEGYGHVVSTVVGLRQVREEVIAQVTSSAAYAELVAHVLYQGLKNYLLTENAVVRRLPGASSLMRLGQSAVHSATPNLESGIDRRLVAFVAANVAETVRDSRDFLNTTLDDAMMHTVAEEIWAVNGPRAVRDVAALLEDDSPGDLMAAGHGVWLAVRSSPVVGRVIDAVVEQFYDAHGEESVAAVLVGLGVTPQRAGAALGEVAARLAPAALDGGGLEAYVRRRLEGFYASHAASRKAVDEG